MPSYISWQKIAIKIKFIDEGTPVAIIGLNFLKHPKKEGYKKTQLVCYVFIGKNNNYVSKIAAFIFVQS